MARDLSFQVQVESQKLLDKLRTFADATHQDMKAVYLDQLRLASNSLARAFPPKTAAATKAVIMSDLASIFSEPGDGFVKEATPITESAGPCILLKTERGAVLRASMEQWNPSGNLAQMDEQHRKYRDRRSGRVHRRGALRQIVGRGKVASFARKILFPRVGMLKAGWILPGSSPVKTKAAQWVEKALKPFGTIGRYTDRMGKNGSGFLQEINPIRYAARQSGLVLIELQKRQKDLERWAKLRLDKAVQRFNGRVAA